MRLVPPRLAVLIIVLVLAGCGGAQVTVQQAPDGTAGLTVPGGAALRPAATATPTPTATATVAGTTSSTGTGTSATDQSQSGQTPADTGTQGTSGGGTAAPSGGTTGTNNQPPPAGSDAQQFENFCAENPGAC